jgi:hypothetical protein
MSRAELDLGALGVEVVNCSLGSSINAFQIKPLAEVL